MDFVTATDRLGASVTHEQLAEELVCSLQSVRQARLDPENLNHRPPPRGWRKAVANLARRRARELVALAEELERAE